MSNEDNSTSPKRTGQLSQKEIIAGVKRIIVTKFSAREIADLQSWLRGVATVANKEEKESGS